MSAPAPALLAAKFHRPAGYGKTTLAAEWVAGQNRPVVWLALDEADNDPLRFCVYFVASLQHADSAVGTDLLPPARNDLSEIALNPDGTLWLMKKERVASRNSTSNRCWTKFGVRMMKYHKVSTHRV